MLALSTPALLMLLVVGLSFGSQNTRCYAAALALVVPICEHCYAAAAVSSG
jgi:hypothetical protein